MKMFKHLVLPMALSLSAIHASIVFAEAPYTLPTPPQSTQPPTSTQKAWLGVALTGIPEALASQLSDIIPSGQGVMVSAVNPNSPAAKAGLKKYDILLAMGEQKIYSPKQLSGLIKSATPGSQINIQVVHAGKQQNTAITLGQQHVPNAVGNSFNNWQPSWRPVRPSYPMMHRRQGGSSTITPQKGTPQNLSWDSFQSVQVKALSDGRYHAEVSYKDTKGEQKQFSFEGKYDEIVEKINAEKELSQKKKQALLNALNMQPNHLLNQPSLFNGSPFNTPFFRKGFGADPFFKQGFLNMPNYGQFFRIPPMQPPTMPSLQGKAL